MGSRVKRLTESDRAALHELYLFTSQALRDSGARATPRSLTVGMGLAIVKRLVDTDDDPTTEEP